MSVSVSVSQLISQLSGVTTITANSGTSGITVSGTTANIWDCVLDSGEFSFSFTMPRTLKNVDLKGLSINIPSLYAMFWVNENLVSVIFKNGITTVTDISYCFYGCTSLTTVSNIPNSVTNISYCFQNCTSLTTAPTIPNSVTNMSYCFYNCTSLTTAPTIPNSVTNMSYCFCNCTSLTTAPTIPSSVTDISSCFGDCTSLTTVPIIPNSVIDISGCFQGCTSLDVLPDLPSNVKKINGYYAGRTSLTTVPDIPSSVTNMSYCFDGCTSLTTAPTIPSSVTNMYRCFQNCTSLTTAPTIPSSVTDIGYCFFQCTNILYINCANVQTTGWEQEKYIGFITVDSVTVLISDDWTIGTAGQPQATFVNINSLSINTLFNFIYSKGFLNLKNITNDKTLKGITVNQDGTSVNIYDCIVTSGSTNANLHFYGNILTNVDLTGLKFKTSDLSYLFYGSETQSIGTIIKLNMQNCITNYVQKLKYSFSNCFNLTPQENEDIVFNTSGWDLSNINDISYCFNNCFPNLTINLFKLHTTNTITTNMFNNCTINVITSLSWKAGYSSTIFGGTNITFNRFITDSSELSTELSNITIITNDEETRGITISGTTANIYDVTFVGGVFSETNHLPNSLVNVDLTGITFGITNFSYMFYHCSNLTTLTFTNFSSSSATNIQYMFNGCSSLSTVPELPNTITNITNCFVGSGITAMPTIPSLITDLTDCFYNCSNLVTTQIPNTVTNLTRCFKNCTSLAIFPTIPSSVTELINTFEGCTSLDIPTIPNWITNLTGCFKGCSFTATPVIPSSVTNLTSCFENCSSLTVVSEVPNTITNLTNAFKNCSVLTSVKNWNIVDFTNVTMTDCFSGCTALTGIYLSQPTHSYGAYNYWKIDKTTTGLKLKAYFADGTASPDVLTTVSNLVDAEGKIDEAYFGTFTTDEFEQLIESEIKITSKDTLSPVNGSMAIFSKNQSSFATNLVYPNGISAGCSTAAATASKEITLIDWNGTTLPDNCELNITFTYANTYGDTTLATPTYPQLSIKNSSGTVIHTLAVCDSRGHYAGTGCWNAGDLIIFKKVGNKALITNSDVRQTTSDYTIMSDNRNVYLGTSGVLTLPDNQYWETTDGAINMNNSDIVGANCIRFNDPLDSLEGLSMPRSDNANKNDTLRVYNGAVILNTYHDKSTQNGYTQYLNKWVDVTSQVTVTATSSSGSYSFSHKKFYLCGCFLKCEITVVFNYSGSAGTNPLKLKISSSLFSFSEILSRTYYPSYYGANIWTNGLNVYSGEVGILTFRPNHAFVSGEDSAFDGIVAVNLGGVS